LDERLNELVKWTESVLGAQGATITPASEDASFRRYFRVETGEQSYIVMDAPPQREDVRPYIRTARCLLDLGLNVPEILDSDLDHGFVLLTDLGRVTYLTQLDEQRVERLYGDALSALLVLQAGTSRDPEYFPPYNEPRLRAEMELFREWYVPHRLQTTLDAAQNSVVDATFSLLVSDALSQPRVWVHRDFHSRNLMVTHRNNPGILDFQDAVTGPVTYDLVSLLRDCYIAWPGERVREWALGYQNLALQNGVPVGEDEDRFLRWFDFIGVQRHIKVLGIFARLYHRDGKAAFLNDLPQVLDYLLEVCARHQSLHAFHDLLRRLHGDGS